MATPTGSVTINIPNVAYIGTFNLDSSGNAVGTGSIPSNIAPGVYTVNVNYSGDSTYPAAQGTANLTVSAPVAQATVGVNLNPSSAPAGTAVQFNITVVGNQ